MKLVRYDEFNTTLVDRDLSWNTYNDNIIEEMRQYGGMCETNDKGKIRLIP